LQSKITKLATKMCITYGTPVKCPERSENAMWLSTAMKCIYII